MVVNRAFETANHGIDTANHGINTAGYHAGQINETANHGINTAGYHAGQINATANHGINTAGYHAGQINATANHGINTANHGINTVDHHAGQFNETANQGIDTVDHHAGQFNETANQGIDTVDHHAGQFNETANQGIDTVDHHAGQFNETANQGINAVDHHAGQFNATANQGIRTVDHHAEAANEALANVADDIHSVATEVHSTMDMLSTPLELFLSMLGPLQYITAANMIIKILEGVGVIKGIQGKLLDAAKGIEMAVQNVAAAVGDINERMFEQSIVQNVTNITQNRPNTEFFFFFSRNQAAVDQLRARNFAAFSTMTELIRNVYVFSVISKSHRKEMRHAPDFNDMHLKVYFLDNRSNGIIPVKVPYLHLSGVQISFISYSLSNVVFQQVFVARGSILNMQQLKVGSLVSFGTTELIRCVVQHEPDKFISMANQQYLNHSVALVPVPAEQDNFSIRYGDQSIAYTECSFPQNSPQLRDRVKILSRKSPFVVNFCHLECEIKGKKVYQVGPGGRQHYKLSNKQILSVKADFKCEGSEELTSEEAVYGGELFASFPNLVFLSAPSV